jgi:hypothetical protein
MRSWMSDLLVTTLLAVGIMGALWSGPCVPTGDCDLDRCQPDTTYRARCCVFDTGCWLNPLTPNNQEWCEDYTIYKCRDSAGRTYKCYYTTASWECGPCCEKAGPIPTLKSQ